MPLTKRRIHSDDWSPIGVKELEANAIEIVKSTSNYSVIAGPGAGKTELLAQRAAYLLQTGAAPRPKRILAISFKRDAAVNLSQRVRQRCHRFNASRFDSMTFDAFAKSILDRFGQALPDRWRPKRDYQILFPTDSMYRGFLHELPEPPITVGTRADIMAISVNEFERRHLRGDRLPESGWTTPTPGQWAADRFWQSSLHESTTSRLSFPMIGRLSELLLRLNPMMRRALQISYSHLFMDEFQDTTHVQYDLVRTIFLGTDTVITAVGDNKQQIMRWAMAMDNPFTALHADFETKRMPLYNNYRSSPDLVRVQHVLAHALDTHAVEAVSRTARTISGDSCAIWNFSTPDVEAERLAGFVAAEIRKYNLTPRDFVLLVRQKPADYAAVLEPAFLNAGIPLRNEAAIVGDVSLQDLLTETVSALLICVLRLAMTPRAGRHWSGCLDFIESLRGIASDEGAGNRRMAREIDRFVLGLQNRYPSPISSATDANAIINLVLNFVGRDRLIAMHPSYAQGDWFAKIIEATARHLEASCATQCGWTQALDAYEGLHSVPLMTIHKSKGLEYHSVIFVGLDDGAWWSFARDQVEATATFFVAFTRAKQRVLFTYCARRGTKSKIATLYSLLSTAGIRTFQIA